jgi:predicted acetylornithine/succinylornithine family transaminase
MHTYVDPQVTFVAGEGSVLVDETGRRYLDFISGLAVTSLGHCHPDVADAICRQAQTLVHVSNLYGNTLGLEVGVALDRLVRTGATGTTSATAEGRVFFCNSGAEANECAFKLARRWAGPGRFEVVSASGSFHGRTLATLAATGQPSKQAPFAPLPAGFSQVPYDDLEAMGAALESGRVAAVVLEPIQGEGGVIVPSPGYLAGVRVLCDMHGALLIVDEIQTGLGRTGEWFGFHAGQVRADIVTVAKALGNGMPVGACWARREVADAFRPGDHGSTFGGQPLAMAAARATLEVMEREEVPSRSARAGERLRRALGDLALVAGVRGAGLLLAVELDHPVAPAVVQRAMGRGLLVNAVRPEAVRLAPSLLVSDAEIDQAVGILGEVLAAVDAAGSQEVPR